MSEIGPSPRAQITSGRDLGWRNYGSAEWLSPNASTARIPQVAMQDTTFNRECVV